MGAPTGSGWRARAGVAVAALVATLAVAPLPGAVAQSPEEMQAAREAWWRNQSDLDAETARVSELDAQVAAAGQALLQVEARLESARARLDDLERRLLQARTAERRAERRNDDAIRELGQAQLVLVTITEALEEHSANLQIDVVAAYKYAGPTARLAGVLDALEEARSVSDFLVAYEHLLAGTENQADLVRVVTVLSEQVETQHARVEVLQRRREAAEQQTRRTRAHTQRLTRAQRTLVEEVRRDRQERRRLLASLEASKRQHERQVARLEAESEALRAELATYSYLGGAPGEGELSWPTDGRATSGFGMRRHPIYKTARLHAGVDIPAPTGQVIYAAADGRVVSAGPRGGYGNAVVIDHGGGLSTVYAHQSGLLVAAGQTVRVAQPIGRVGSTGLSTGPHLHFEVRVGGTPKDPMAWY